MTKPTTTRRGILSAMAVAPAIVAVPAVAASPAPTGTSLELAALIAAYDAASVACTEYYENVMSPMRAAADAKAAALPHTTMTIWGQECSTADSDSVNIAQVMTRELSAHEKLFYREWRSLLAAHKRRERAKRRILRFPAIVAAGRRDDDLNTAQVYAGYDVCHYPAATAADLHAKLAFMVKHDMGDGMDWLSELLADAERLAGAA